DFATPAPFVRSAATTSSFVSLDGLAAHPQAKAGTAALNVPPRGKQVRMWTAKSAVSTASPTAAASSVSFASSVSVTSTVASALPAGIAGFTAVDLNPTGGVW